MFDTKVLEINMGPQHPSTHGVLRVILKLDGETVVDADCDIGYLHRGVEKLAEHREYFQALTLTDRMDYIAAVSSNLGYVEAVEKLLAIKAPPRAQWVRMMLTELNRGSLTNPRLTVINADGFRWAREARGSYDAIIVDFPDPVDFSVGKLYTESFYRELSRLLAPDGTGAASGIGPTAARMKPHSPKLGT